MPNKNTSNNNVDIVDKEAATKFVDAFLASEKFSSSCRPA